MSHKVFGAMLIPGCRAMREALARHWKAMVRQASAYHALAALDPGTADYWATIPGATREQRTQAMEEAARALTTSSVTGALSAPLQQKAR